MGYRIEYDQKIGKYEVRKEKTKDHSMILVIAAVVILTGVMVLWPKAEDALFAAIIPGDDTVTVQAFQNMTDDMRSGAYLTDALYTFCHYVIHGT